MARSSKKGPYVDQRVLKKVLDQKKAGTNDPIKTWARACQIAPEFIGFTFLVHNGKHFIKVYVLENMVGYRLGEFSKTRLFRGHGKVVARDISKT